MEGEELLEKLREHRRTVYGCATALLAALALLLGWEGPETSAGNVAEVSSFFPDMEQTEQMENATGAGKRAATFSPSGEESRWRERKIRGAEKAALGETLTDPFSMRHETREEAKARRSTAGQPAVSEQRVAPPAAARLPGASLKAAEAEHPAPVEEIRLQGIVTGEHGSIAIIKKGDKTCSLAVGERLDGRTISSIGKREVSFEDGETISLTLP